MKTVVVTSALMIEEGKILLTQRRADAEQALLWEFPGGKVEEGEEPREALKRELREELEIEVSVGSIFDVSFHIYPERPILLLVYHSRREKGVPKPVGCHDLRWVDPRGVRDLPMPSADDPVRERLLSGSILQGS